MCGIIGYIGGDNAVPILIEGLKRLEYRGYDSAGIAIINNAQLAIRKAVGKLKNLEEVVANDSPTGTIGIRKVRHIRMRPKALSSCITASSRLILP